MDAASCYILGTALISSSQAEPSQKQARDMFAAAWAGKGEFPQTLFLPAGQFQVTLKAEAERLGNGRCVGPRVSAARLYRGSA